jgi:transketolase
MGFISRDEFKGRNIKFGVREFGMAAIMNGVSLSGFFKPYCGTFLCFSDYMRPAIRLASLIGLDVSYQFTHDSVFLGEDGPTHQPVEHAAALRTIPNLYVFRPADGNETKASWLCGMKHSGPKAYLLSRQNLPNLAETNKSHAEGVGRGAYVLLPEEDGQLDLVMFSSGSELHLALEVANKLKADGVNVRLVSVPCFELFDMQDNEYKEWVLAKHARDRVSIEAQVGFGWEKFTGHSGRIFSVERFGMSAPAGKIQERLGFTVEALYSDMQKWIKR